MGSRRTLTSYQSASLMECWRDRIDDYGWGLWAVERRDTREWIGVAGLDVPILPLPFSPCVELVIRLAHSQWGRGFASEAARTVVEAGFTHLFLDEIVGSAPIENQRSRHLMQRIGMREDGATFLHPALPGDSPQDVHCLYRISRGALRPRIAKADHEDDGRQLSGRPRRPA